MSYLVNHGLFLLLLLLSLPITACGPGATEPPSDGQPQVGNKPDLSGSGVEASTVRPHNLSLDTSKPDSSGQRDLIPATVDLHNLKPNVIRWSTASEHDSFGYDIYRGSSEDGPFSVVNGEVIPGAGTTDMPNSYEFLDESIESDTIYWYYIESISLTGERKRITPIYPSKRKPTEQKNE